TSAPRTGPPHVEVTWKRTTSVRVPAVTMRGEVVSASTSSRAGGLIFAASSGFPPAGQPLARGGLGGGGAAAITALGTEVAIVEPPALLAWTRSLSVFPTSAEPRV